MGCGKLQSIQVAKGSGQFRSYDGVVYTSDGATLVVYPAGNSRKSYSVRKGVEKIGENAFYRCSSLTGVQLPNSVKVIGGNAFAQCAAFTKISLPSSVRQIESGAFSGCAKLNSVDFSDGLERIGKSAFRSCKLKKIMQFDPSFLSQSLYSYVYYITKECFCL